MTTAADIRADSRLRLREAMLAATHDEAVTGGWSAVRMGAVASRVGVSRQTLHAEFGTKEALGQALVLREVELFLAGVVEALARHPDDLSAGIFEAVTFTLEVTAQNPLLQTILATNSGAADDTLLPLLSSRSQPLLQRSSDVLYTWVTEAQPEVDPEVVAEVVDSVVRLVVSHAVAPGGPAATVGRRIARLAVAGLDQAPASG
jgi:AcrR family transcriptional regulator